MLHKNELGTHHTPSALNNTSRSLGVSTAHCFQTVTSLGFILEKSSTSSKCASFDISPTLLHIVEIYSALDHGKISKPPKFVLSRTIDGLERSSFRLK